MSTLSHCYKKRLKLVQLKYVSSAVRCKLCKIHNMIIAQDLYRNWSNFMCLFSSLELLRLGSNYRKKKPSPDTVAGVRALQLFIVTQSPWFVRALINDRIIIFLLRKCTSTKWRCLHNSCSRISIVCITISGTRTVSDHCQYCIYVIRAIFFSFNFQFSILFSI